MRRAAHVLEILDQPVSLADRSASLGDIERLNTWFGGHTLTLRGVTRLLRRMAHGQPVTIVDLGTGSAGLAIRVVRWARQAGIRLRVIALDLDADTARLARAMTGAYPEIRVVRADAMALPFSAESVDVVMSSLFLHHLAPEVAMRAFREMARVSRLGFVVNDLWRARLGLLGVWLATRLLRCHPISRHDGPLSVRRSYAPDEIQALASRSGVGTLEVRRYPWVARVIVVGERQCVGRGCREMIR